MSDVPATQRPDHDVEPRIHACATCRSTLVQPLDWSSRGAGGWSVLLRCPECEARDTRVLDAAGAAALSDHVERGMEMLLSDLQALAAANRDAEIRRFRAALDAGLIGADDFASARLV